MLPAAKSTNSVLDLIPRNLHSQSGHASISRLPTELLEFIFIQLACHYFWSDACLASPRRLPDWIHVTLVSSHWRDVALNCSTLWSYIFTGMPPRWVDMLLARSRQAPLRIHMDGWNPGCLMYMDKLMKHAQRIEALHFHTHWDRSSSLFFAAICSSAPRLRNLDLSMDGCSVSAVLSDLHKLCHLTTLSLRTMPPSLQQDVLSFQAVLKCMPYLKYLHLEDALTSARDFISCVAFDTLQKIDLPCLLGLLIVAPLSTIIAFLSSINVPASTEMRLRCKCEDRFSIDNYDRFCSVLARNYDNDLVPSRPTIHSVVAEVQYKGVALVFSTSPRCDHHPSSLSSLISSLAWGCGILLEIGVELPMTLSSWSFISDVCASVHTANIQTLHLIRPPPLRAFWREMLSGLQKVQCIKLSDGYMPDGLASVFIPHITSTDGVAEICQIDQLLAPKLEELELVDIKFWETLWPDLDLGSEMLVPALGLDSVSFWKRRPLYKMSAGGSTLGHPPFEELESLYAALSNRKGSRGRLTMTRGHVNRDRHPFLYDLTGRWEDGQFYVVNVRRYPDPKLEDFLNRSHGRDWVGI